eukprot:COSAG06_NODE_50572_length_317_cov_25.027523_1_plen_55_part_00
MQQHCLLMFRTRAHPLAFLYVRACLPGCLPAWLAACLFSCLLASLLSCVLVSAC